MHSNNVRCVANERQCNDVRAEFDCPTKVFLVFFRKSRNIHSYTWKVDSLVIADWAWYLNHGSNRSRSHFGGTQPNLAVVNKKLVANTNVTGKAREGGSTNVDITLNVFDGDFESCAFFKHYRSVSEASESNLWSLKVY